MEAPEEVMASKEYTQMIKRRRTKRRQRPTSPLALTMASSSSSTAQGGGGRSGGGGVSDNSGGFERVTSSPSNSIDFTKSTEEVEEDMANCLILLAQGAQTQKLSESPVVATTEKIGLYVHQCKTCNRCFPSFQALGGHRASHKRPKPNLDEKKTTIVSANGKPFPSSLGQSSSLSLSLQISNTSLSSTNNKSKVHECSICGAEFSSGQALGGHMRRHRATPLATSNPNESPEAKKPSNLLSLDLNLPAPEDDHGESKFPFGSKEKVIVFSASSLVDCHY